MSEDNPTTDEMVTLARQIAASEDARPDRLGREEGAYVIDCRRVGVIRPIADCLQMNQEKVKDGEAELWQARYPLTEQKKPPNPPRSGRPSPC